MKITIDVPDDLEGWIAQLKTGEEHYPDALKQHLNAVYKAFKTAKKSVDIDNLFEKFWTAYPRRADKVRARTAFSHLRPDATLLEDMLCGIQRAKASAQWQSEGGKYIPLPSTWLRGRRWEDAQQTSASGYMERDYTEHEDKMLQYIAELEGDNV